MGFPAPLSWLAPAEEGPLHRPVNGLAGDAALELLCGKSESPFPSIVREMAGSPRNNLPSIGALTEGTEEYRCLYVEIGDNIRGDCACDGLCGLDPARRCSVEATSFMS